MRASTNATVLQSCPACTAAAVRRFAGSRRTGHIVATCRSCGCYWLANPLGTDEIVDNQAYDRTVYESFVNAKRSDPLNRDYRSTSRRIGELIQSGGRALFDVGAGAGDFLTIARDCGGFTAHGNELAPGAIEMAKEITGIELHAGDLTTIEGANLYDAVTMWCVLAHVADPDALLISALRILKPGGVLFLRTPRWSAMDSLALTAARVSGGRLTRLLDRRLNDHHMMLGSVSGLESQATRLGFDVIEVSPRSRYSLTTETYLDQFGVPARLSTILAKILDSAVDRDLAFRNVLDLYARKPRN